MTRQVLMCLFPIHLHLVVDSARTLQQRRQLVGLNLRLTGMNRTEMNQTFNCHRFSANLIYKYDNAVIIIYTMSENSHNYVIPTA